MILTILKFVEKIKTFIFKIIRIKKVTDVCVSFGIITTFCCNFFLEIYNQFEDFPQSKPIFNVWDKDKKRSYTC